MRAEYLLMAFRRETSRSPEGDIYHHSPDLHALRLGLTWRFATR